MKKALAIVVLAILAAAWIPSAAHAWGALNYGPRVYGQGAAGSFTNITPNNNTYSVYPGIPYSGAYGYPVAGNVNTGNTYGGSPYTGNAYGGGTYNGNAYSTGAFRTGGLSNPLDPASILDEVAVGAVILDCFEWETPMYRKSFLAVLLAGLISLGAASDAHAWGAIHVGYTRVGVGGVYHASATAVGGYGGYAVGGVRAASVYGVNTYRAGVYRRW